MIPDRDRLIVEVACTLSVGETARRLNKRKQYIVSLMDSGKLPFVWLGKRRRIRLVDLDNYLAALARESTKPDPRVRQRRRRQPPVTPKFAVTNPLIASLLE